MLLISELLLVAATLVFAGLLLYSCSRATTGRRRKRSDEAARSIFDAYEPEGFRTDYYPGKGPPPSEYLL